MPPIGDLFSSSYETIQETINSLMYLLKQRVNDIELRKEMK